MRRLRRSLTLVFDCDHLLEVVELVAGLRVQGRFIICGFGVCRLGLGLNLVELWYSCEVQILACLHLWLRRQELSMRLFDRNHIQLQESADLHLGKVTMDLPLEW